jgi:uroporphyrinogen-III decarboxylase
MNGRERIIAALKRKETDRLPVMEMGIDWAVMKGLGYRTYLDMIEGLDLDGAAVNQMLYVLGWRRWVLPHVKTYTDEWGVRSRLTGELLPIPVGHPILCEADLKGYRPPRPEKSPLLKAIRHVRKRFPDRAVAMLSRNDFSAAWFLCGMDVLLMAFIENPGFARSLIELVNDYYCTLYRLCIGAGVDVIYLTDDYAFKTGTLMSRDHFKVFVLPALRRGVQAVHDAGGLCIKHTDGDISGIIDLIIGTGIDGLGPLEPAAGNSLPGLSGQWGDRVTLLGNVDVDLLSRADVVEVAAVTRDLVRGMAGGKGFILSSGNTITASVNPLCFKTMVGEGRKAWTTT